MRYINDIGSTMKADYEKFPELPPGCLFNHNKKTGATQVYRLGKNRTPGCQKKRESVGYIRNGVFSPSKQWLMAQQIVSLLQTNKDLKTGIAEDTLQQRHEATTSFTKIHEAVVATKVEFRDAAHCSIPMVALMMGAILNALTGDADCVSIGDFITRNKELFHRYIPECDFEFVSHDTVRRSLMFLDPEKFEQFLLHLLEPLIKTSLRRVIAADGQAVKASGRMTVGKDGKERMSGHYMVMNIYDTTNRVTLAQQVIDKKTNEITVGPELLEGVKLDGSIVTADAMSCQINFTRVVLHKNAHYCISLKGNQDKTWDEVKCLFNTTHPDQILSRQGEVELDHGRIERRDISMIRGALLSKPLREKWPGLAGGAVIRIASHRQRKRTGVKTDEDRYYITSMAASEENLGEMAEVIRSHWGVENNLHYVLDTHFGQDRMQSNDPTYLVNREGLHKLALALLENYRFYLWDTNQADETLSLHVLQQRCRDPREGIRCLGYALGWLK